jgi:hypothetical protein
MDGGKDCGIVADIAGEPGWRAKSERSCDAGEANIAGMVVEMDEAAAAICAACG